MEYQKSFGSTLFEIYFYYWTLYIDASDSGVYSCAAGKYQDDAGNKLEDVKQRTLVVHPIIAPKIITTNMNGSSASVKVCRPIQSISF